MSNNRERTDEEREELAQLLYWHEGGRRLPETVPTWGEIHRLRGIVEKLFDRVAFGGQL